MLLQVYMLERHKLALQSHEKNASNMTHGPTHLKLIMIDMDFFRQLIDRNQDFYESLKNSLEFLNGKIGKYKEYHEVSAFEDIRKHRGIVQILFRIFQFRFDVLEEEFKKAFVETLNIVNRINFLCFHYRYLLKQYWLHRERKKIPFDRAVKSNSLYFKYCQTKKFYYFYNEKGQYQEKIHKRLSCYIHGLTPSNTDWCRFCYHNVCLNCGAYNVTNEIHVHDNFYAEHYENYVMFKPTPWSHFIDCTCVKCTKRIKCVECNKNLYIRIIHENYFEYEENYIQPYQKINNIMYYQKYENKRAFLMSAYPCRDPD